ncbi:MAG: cation:proton antiporter, partial [Planctomycetes bacterium]|nr:cation:proton antiporter [Planctomycetota bacterium]
MDLLHEIFVVLAVAAGVVFFFQKIRIPSIVGFLIAGIAAGPSGLKIIADPEDVEVLSEIGILLLLFSIGLEFSLKQLFSIRKAVVVGGTVQVLLTAAAGFACGEIAGRPLNESVLIGILVALSSTAVILKILQQRSEVDTPQGRTTLGILIFQDLLVVPAMLIVPVLGGASDSGGDPWYLLLG